MCVLVLVQSTLCSPFFVHYIIVVYHIFISEMFCICSIFSPNKPNTISVLPLETILQSILTYYFILLKCTKGMHCIPVSLVWLKCAQVRRLFLCIGATFLNLLLGGFVDIYKTRTGLLSMHCSYFCIGVVTNSHKLFLTFLMNLTLTFIIPL